MGSGWSLGDRQQQSQVSAVPGSHHQQTYFNWFQAQQLALLSEQLKMNFCFQQLGNQINPFAMQTAPPASYIYIVPVFVPQSTPAQQPKPTSSRRAWSKQQDKRILQLIEELDLKDCRKIPYKLLAKYFPQRTSKQIRERYLNNLDANIVKTAFTTEEDDAIVEYFKTNGPKWKRLSRMMPGRTSTALKNRFNTKLKTKMVEPKSDPRAVALTASQESHNLDTKTIKIVDGPNIL